MVVDIPFIPIFVVEGMDDVYVYASVEDAALSLEPWWVEQKEGSVYDAAGRLLHQEVVGYDVALSLLENCSANPHALESILRNYFKAIGEPIGDDATCDLDCLVQRCHKFMQPPQRSGSNFIADIVSLIKRLLIRK